MDVSPQRFNIVDTTKRSGSKSPSSRRKSQMNEDSRKDIREKQDAPPTSNDLRKRAGKDASKYSKDFERYSMLFRSNSRKITELRWSDVKVGRLLGKGSFCDVYEAKLSAKGIKRDKMVEILNNSKESVTEDAENKDSDSDDAPLSDDDDQVFALKYIDPKYVKEHKNFASIAVDLVIEAKILSCLSHPNIVTLYGVTGGSISKSFCKKGYFLLLDKLESDLDRRMKAWLEASRGCSKRERARQLQARFESTIMGVADGMHYLHSNRIIFRDLKPANVGFTQNGTVKIFDFGLAREIVRDDVKMTGFTGSVRYMAPEVARREHYGLSADVYSFGILLWEVCSLSRAFSSMDADDHMEMVVISRLRPKIQSIEGGSSSMRKMVKACWSHNPSKRPTFEEIKAKVEKEVARGSSPGQRREGMPNHVERSHRSLSPRRVSVGGQRRLSGIFGGNIAFWNSQNVDLSGGNNVHQATNDDPASQV